MLEMNTPTSDEKVAPPIRAVPEICSIINYLEDLYD